MPNYTAADTLMAIFGFKRMEEPLTKEQLAAQLDGREYTDEVTPNLREQAKAASLVIVYGASDDLMEFDGLFRGEADACGGGVACLDIDKIGLLENECDDSECPYFERLAKIAPRVEGIWTPEDHPEYCWAFKTKIPHATFTIMEDGQKFCRGIVFAWEDVLG